MKTRSPLLGIVVILAFVMPACGGDTSGTTTTEPPGTTTTPSESTTTTRSTSGVTISPPAQIGAGTSFSVSWTGPNNEGDYITIVAAGADEGAYESYFYTATGPQGSLVAPTEAGQYEIRYVDGASETTVLGVTVTISAYAVTLEAPTEVEAGTEFQVTWTGPDGPGDYVTIVPVNAAEGTYESYFDTDQANPGALVAPVNDGSYEIRYVSGSGGTLDSIPITVTPYVVTLDAPEEVAAAATFEVTWTGPDGPSDYITIVAAGAPVGAYLDYGYTAEGSTITLTAPAEPGDYEIRYASDRVGSFTFASIPIVVK